MTKKTDKKTTEPRDENTAPVETTVTAPEETKEQSENAKHWSKYRTRYDKTADASGKPHQDNADDVANTLRELDLEQVYDVVEQATGEELRKKYAHLNPGMQRMNLGNKYRGFVNRKAKAEASAKVKTDKVA